MPLFDLTTTTPDDTTALARRIGRALSCPAVLCLDGPVGAGKSHFARSLIQSLLEVPEDVPSPTFTLVQTYDATPGPIWHADLYRLTSPEEAEELGLTEAFDTAICLIEWPNRLGDLIPRGALMLRFEPISAESRRITADTDVPDMWQGLTA